MNKNFSIVLMVLAIVAVTMTLFLRRVDATVLNQDFSIETLYGDANLINDIFEISNIRQEGTNSFSRVILTTTEAEIIPIRFDARHQLDERQLEMREFYRGTAWWTRNPQNRIETENFRVLIVDNWPNPDIFHILNKETNAFIAIENNMDSSHFVHWTLQFFMEQDGVLYVVIAGENEPKARFYEVDFDRATLTHRFTFEQESSVGGQWLLNENGIYFYENGGWDPLPSGATGGWDPETGEDTLTASRHPFYMVNFETQSFELRPSPTGITPWGIGRIYWNDYLIREGIVTYNDNGEQGHFDGISIINLETGHRHVFENTTWDTWAETQDSEAGGLSGTWMMEFYPVDDYLIETTRINEFTQIIKIYDLNAMTLIYHGRINLRRDQGLLADSWRGAQNFEVRLRN